MMVLVVVMMRCLLRSALAPPSPFGLARKHLLGYYRRLQHHRFNIIVVVAVVVIVVDATIVINITIPITITINVAMSITISITLNITNNSNKTIIIVGIKAMF